MSKTQGEIRWPGVTTLGAHNEEIYGGELGYSAEKLAELSALLAAHQASSRGPLYESTTQMPVMIDKTLAERFEEGDEYVYTPN